MALSFGSRLLLTEAVRVVDPITGEQSAPVFMFYQKRFTGFAPDDRAVSVDTSRDWAHYALDNLADANAWWVLADMSGVVDPFDELVPATLLRCPSLGRYQLDIITGDDGVRRTG